MTALILSGCGPTGTGVDDIAPAALSNGSTSNFKVYLPEGSGSTATSGIQAKASSSSNSPNLGGGKSKSVISDVFVQFDRIELRSEGDHTLVESQIERTVSLLHHFDLFEGSSGISEVLSEIREIRLHISETGSYLVKSSSP